MWKRAKITFFLLVAQESQSCKHKYQWKGWSTWILVFALMGCWLWLSAVDGAVKYVAVCEEGMRGDSEPSQAFQSGKGLITKSCWEDALLFLNSMGLIRGWKARWLKMFLWTGHKAWRRFPWQSLLLDIINLDVPVLIILFSVLSGDLQSWLNGGGGGGGRKKKIK